MPIFTYTYPFASFPNNIIAKDALYDEVNSSSITIALQSIDNDLTDVFFNFKAVLSGAEIIVLNAIVAAHQGIPLTDTITVVQGTSGSIPWLVTIPSGSATYISPTTGSIFQVTGTVHLDNSILTTTGSVTVNNFPVTQSVKIDQSISLPISLSNTPLVTITNPVTTASISNLPVTQSVFVGSSITLPVSVSNTPIITGSVTVNNPTVLPITQSVFIGGSGIIFNVSMSNTPIVTVSNPVTTASISNLPLTQSIIANTALPTYITSPIAQYAGLSANVTAYGTLRTSDEPGALFSDEFDSIDTASKWISTASNGGTITALNGVGLLNVSNVANRGAALTSQPTFPTNGLGFRTFAVTKQFSVTPQTGSHLFWGYGTQQGVWSVTNPLFNGIGFEEDISGSLNAIVYASGSKTFSYSVTRPTDNGFHTFVVLLRSDTVLFYMDAFEVPTAAVSYPQTTTFNLPIRLSVINGAAPSFAPTASFAAVGVADTARGSTAISDGTLPWRKATVDSSGSLKITGSFFQINQAAGTQTVNGTVTATQGNASATQNWRVFLSGSNFINNGLVVSLTSSQITQSVFIGASNILPVSVSNTVTVTGTLNTIVTFPSIQNVSVVSSTLISASIASGSVGTSINNPLWITGTSNAIMEGNLNTEFYPDPSNKLDGTQISTNIDIGGSLQIRGAVLTDETSFRDDFAGSSLTSTPVGTITFTNGSDQITGVGTNFNLFNSQQYIKRASDANNTFVGISSVESATEATLDSPYTGTSGATTGQLTAWLPNSGSGGTVTVTNSKINLAAANTSGSVASINRLGDYVPFVLNTNVSINQRVANQQTVFGFQDILQSPNQQAVVIFDGTDNTVVKFRSSFSSAATDVETTTVSLSSSQIAQSFQTLSSSQNIKYEIDVTPSFASLLINGKLAARHETHIPGPYTPLNVVSYIENTGVATTGTTASIDLIAFQNVNNIQANNGFRAEPQNIQIVATSPLAIQQEIRSDGLGNLSVREFEPETYSVLAETIAIGNNKSMLSILNTTSNKIIKLVSIKIMNAQTGGITGVFADFRLIRITGHSVGTLLTPVTFDSADVLDAGVTVRTNATVAGEAATTMLSYIWSTDEIQFAGFGSSAAQDKGAQNTMGIFEHKKGRKPIILRQNEGITIKQTTNSTAGTFDIELIFTEEPS